MNWSAFTPIARTVLYEGHVLYPYRPSALKNRQQWNFGTLYPPGGTEEPSSFRLEALVESDREPRVELQLCFLQDGIERIAAAVAPGTTTGAFADVHFEIAAGLQWVESGLWQLGVDVSNVTALPTGADRQTMLPLAMSSAHLRCGIEGGAFVSAQAPGPERAAAAARCSSRGVYPVLIGEPGQRQYMLAAPIILEDYPRIAPQSLGDFCDATEMDEMLALRVATLTDSEKDEIRAVGGEAGRILERCADLQRVKGLHGGVSAAPWDPWAQPPDSVAIGGGTLRVGDRVRLHPRARAGNHFDIFDQVLEGKTACIQAIEQDLEGNIQLAVVADDDPGRDLGELKQSGHRFFYTPQEVEPL